MLSHPEKYYYIVVKDENEKELFELKYDVEDLKEANEDLWKYFIEVNKELNELKMKKEERKPDEEFNFKSTYAIHLFPTECSCCVE